MPCPSLRFCFFSLRFEEEGSGSQSWGSGFEGGDAANWRLRRRLRRRLGHRLVDGWAGAVLGRAGLMAVRGRRSGFVRMKLKICGIIIM